LNFDLEGLGYGAILTTEENPVMGIAPEPDGIHRGGAC
jgi:hypothetical protein